MAIRQISKAIVPRASSDQGIPRQRRVASSMSGWLAISSDLNEIYGIVDAPINDRAWQQLNRLISVIRDKLPSRNRSVCWKSSSPTGRAGNMAEKVGSRLPSVTDCRVTGTTNIRHETSHQDPATTAWNDNNWSPIPATFNPRCLRSSCTRRFLVFLSSSNRYRPTPFSLYFYTSLCSSLTRLQPVPRRCCAAHAGNFMLELTGSMETTSQKDLQARWRRVIFHHLG